MLQTARLLRRAEFGKGWPQTSGIIAAVNLLDFGDICAKIGKDLTCPGAG